MNGRARPHAAARGAEIGGEDLAMQPELAEGSSQLGYEYV